MRARAREWVSPSPPEICTLVPKSGSPDLGGRGWPASAGRVRGAPSHPKRSRCPSPACSAEGEGLTLPYTPRSPLRSSGSERSLCPVAEKIAFEIAGASTGTPGSPIPVGVCVEGMIWTSTTGISLMRVGS